MWQLYLWDETLKDYVSVYEPATYSVIYAKWEHFSELGFPERYAIGRA